MGTRFALKHQCHCGDTNYHPSLIALNNLKERWLQQKIEDAHDYKVVYNNWLTWDAKNHVVSANLIKQHFQQILGINGSPCAYLMCENSQVPNQTVHSEETLEAELFNNQMIKDYPVIKPTELLGNIAPPYGDLPLNMYTHKDAEDNAQCCQKLYF